MNSIKTLMPAFTAMLLVTLSCERNHDDTHAHANFVLNGRQIDIVSDDNQIQTGRYNDIEYPESDTCYYYCFNTILFSDGNEDYSLKTDFVLREDSSKLYYFYHNYLYSNPDDFFNKIISLSNRFIDLPEHSPVFTDSVYINTSILTFEIENYKKEGLIVQLYNHTNGKVYMTDILSGSETTNRYEITDTWIEKQSDGNEDRLYLSSSFDLELVNVEDVNDKAHITDGKCTFWFIHR